MTSTSPCRLWAVGTWREARQIGGDGLCFSPDGRLVVVQDASKVIRLVETETGRTLARLESPDLCGVRSATFSPDGSRLVVTTNDGPAVHVWDLRAIRRHLADDGPRLGRAGLSRHRSGDRDRASRLPRRSSSTWAPSRPSVQSLLQQAQQLEAGRQDRRSHRRAPPGGPAVPRLRRGPQQPGLAAGDGAGAAPQPGEALEHARHAVELAPASSCTSTPWASPSTAPAGSPRRSKPSKRAWRPARANSTAFDLFFLAMAHHRLGHSTTPAPAGPGRCAGCEEQEDPGSRNTPRS